MSAPYAELTPELVLDAVDASGQRTDGRLHTLNSYENRVYQLGLEDSGFVVAKFYRPERWSDAAILEEHAFAAELVEAEIPVVPPITLAAGNTLADHRGFRFAIFERRGGRSPELEDPAVLEWIGRFMGRLHMVGMRQPFAHRPMLSVDSFGREPREFLLASALLPDEFRDAYAAISARLIDQLQRAFEEAGAIATLRLHGDCHNGNILWTDAGPHFVDLDDARMGPAVQDLWMLLSGNREDMSWQMSELLAGYELFREFDRRELRLIEPLRCLRMIHYAAWLARRWGDPAFPAAFPWFGTRNYWQDHIASLHELEERLAQPPLRV